MLAKHVTDYGNVLKVLITSTKTRHVPYSLIIPSCDDSRVCALLAWRTYQRILRPNPDGPAFLLSHTSPLTGPLVVKLMKDALSGDPSLDVRTISMHSLRRGAAQEAQKEGSSVSDIMARGGWASRSGVKPYLSH